MSTSSRSAERFKYGICLNDECPLCKEKKIQQIPMRKDLICTNPDCAKPLRECPPPKSGTDFKKIGIIAAVVAILGGGGVGAMLMRGDGPKIDKIELTPAQIALVIDETPKAQLNAKILDEEGKEISADEITLEWTIDNDSVASITQDGEVTAVGQGNATITVQIKGEEKFATCPVEVKIKEVPDDTDSTDKSEKTEGPDNSNPPVKEPKITPKQPSWGVYSGERDKNGLPNGQGELKITRSHDINGETAQPGETIKGVFRNGYVNMGKWYKKDGNVVVVKDIKVL